ncbi:hypothetical protein acsn021_39000 [Anaerocolumna cellulosilytica]|uniref:Uncharacterized protein n=1 Tax=Anaerocolumna cellulosilytica TaxID=433286 RepID=A0A6S6RC48_9FIRM|nr:hypothetical protein [Anaerocolumna cellulosilytica]MBB5196300.1 hypothetical protein [Anaerocolumna cellulosilytica]BCJ96331.1 hypothetical protein acsn021_39000 [Anaerocolumna cellulosilytica]
MADDKQKNIANAEIHSKLKKTHNNSFMQREQKKAGINILEKEDIDRLNSAVKKKNGEKSPYNAIRFTKQEIDDKSVDDSIEVAEKAINNLDKKVQESKSTEIQIGNIKVCIDI